MLQLVDYTIFVAKANLKIIIVIKRILTCFELIEGLKDNFKKIS